MISVSIHLQTIYTSTIWLPLIIPIFMETFNTCKFISDRVMQLLCSFKVSFLKAIFSILNSRVVLVFGTFLRFARIHWTIITPTSLKYFMISFSLPHCAFNPFALLLQPGVHLRKFVSILVSIKTADRTNCIVVEGIILRRWFITVRICVIGLSVICRVESTCRGNAIDALLGTLDILVHFGSDFYLLS